MNGNDLDIIITIQPTSPLIKKTEIEETIKIFENDQTTDTVMAVVDDRHLRWGIDSQGNAKPEYQSRLNRQQLPKSYKETGSIIACTRKTINSGSRIGENIKLLEIPFERSIDIDSIYDWYICENILKKKKILFHVVGYAEVGLGHVYRTLMLANEFIMHDIVFLVDEESHLAYENIKKFNYNVIKEKKENIINEIKNINPDLIINDILDTDKELIQKQKEIGSKVVNFEDLGSGKNHADLVFNALYPESTKAPHIHSGPSYFCLRDEFIYPSDTNNTKTTIENILLTFGGVDEGNLTNRILEVVAPICAERKIKITIITGPGYKYQNKLTQNIEKNCNQEIEYIKTTNRISDYMMKADMAITSGGRTVLELSACNVPTMVICQNTRETTHIFADISHGVVNLGYRENVSDEIIAASFKNILDNSDLRDKMKKSMKELDLNVGKKNVVALINQLI